VDPAIPAIPLRDTDAWWEEMVIGVLATNEPAQRLYEREGFRPWVLLNLGKVPDPDV
jgi:hypothetical protein